MNNETNTTPETAVEYVPIVKRRTFAQKLGCSIMVLVWFLCMMIPLFFIILAIEEEITITHPRNIPDKHEHPLLQIKLIMEIDFRGLSITNSSIHEAGDKLCIETKVNYLLWQGQGENAQFCDCYTRTSAADNWEYDLTTTGSCSQIIGDD